MGMSMTVIGGDLDDDDDMGIPPEILEMMQMTEMMHERSSFFGAPKKKKKELPRVEESHADIMAKMNKLSEEIGERSNKKYE